MAGLCIYQGSEFASVSEDARFLNILGFWICQVSQYTMVLKMSRVLNIPEFWLYHSSQYFRFLIYQGFEYASGSVYAGILNIPRFCICQDYTGFWICLNICLNNSWICLLMPKFAWGHLNVPENAEICVNKTINLFHWLLFYISPFPPWLHISKFTRK